ncbi:lipopolysaccharide assembly protein LapB [Methylosinus sp. Sm6]|uniref:tetratricopeptide repeat protein n=1 Tax=Methylosinus sp. Sm6 TaxID=2866948 RepID=UPI001C98E9C4|nr:hypothetical protein [Methylosinus sp. Sm6]MBY6243397.1 hypothetical protein [Methylosinus sp. Sm6]
MRLGVIAVLLALGWRMVRHAAADFLFDDPPAALSWVADDPRALSTLVRMELGEAGESGDPIESAARLLSVDPLAFEGLSLYGVALSRAGDTARADDIFRTAAEHAPLDLIAHGELFLRSAEARDHRTAIRELDILLRGRPHRASLYQSANVLIRTNVEAAAELGRSLATQPPWRVRMFVHLCETLEKTDVLIALFQQLSASGAPPSLEERRAFLDRLVRDGRVDEAYFFWLAQVPQSRWKELGYLYNGRFRHAVSNLAFDWRFLPARGAKIDVVPDGNASALRVRFFGTRVLFAHVMHLLALPAGTYAFSGSAKLDHVESERGLRWRLYCHQTKATLGATDLLVGTTPWTPFRSTFVVAPTDCPAQWLVLEIPARAVLETQVSGEARYKALQIERLDSEADRL